MYTLEVPGWFELVDRTLYVWEGVCAVLQRRKIHLYKLKDGIILYAVIPRRNIMNITSTGYWECAELHGYIANHLFYYHAQTPEVARIFIEFLLDSYHVKHLKKLVIRFDPDPLRLEDEVWIQDRIRNWKLLNTMSTNFRIMLDSNMPQQ